jgi:hypothetical protein
VSATLMARPTDKGTDLPDELKYKLQDRLSDGEIIFTSYDIPYLQGLIDCDVAGAAKLVEMIKKYERVSLWLAY